LEKFKNLVNQNYRNLINYSPVAQTQLGIVFEKKQPKNYFGKWNGKHFLADEGLEKIVGRSG
jgi:hypothetical protein